MEQLDLDILYFFNRTISSASLDGVMSFLTNVRNWIPIYLLAIVYLLWRHKWYGLRVVVAVAILAGLVDALTNVYVKDLIARPRPCAVDAAGIPLIDWLRLPDGGRHGFSLPSSHALNNFAAATFFVLLFPSRKVFIGVFAAASFIAMTRPYLGLHYPSDMLAGIIIGVLCGYIFAKAFLLLDKRYFYKSKTEI